MTETKETNQEYLDRVKFAKENPKAPGWLSENPDQNEAKYKGENTQSGAVGVSGTRGATKRSEITDTNQLRRGIETFAKGDANEEETKPSAAITTTDEKAGV